MFDSCDQENHPEKICKHCCQDECAERESRLNTLCNKAYCEMPNEHKPIKVVLLVLCLRNLSALRGDHLPAAVSLDEDVGESLNNTRAIALVAAGED